MQLVEAKDKNKFDAFVKNAKGSFLQLWDWGEFKKSLGENIFRFALEDNDKYILTAQITKYSLQGKEYLYIAYGPVVGSEQNIDMVLEIFFKELCKSFSKVFFVRFEIRESFVPTKQIRKSIDLNPHKTLILDLTKTEEELLVEMKQKTRYNIKIAEKHNIKVISNAPAEENSKAVELIRHSSKRAGVHAFPAEYYLDMLNYFNPDPKNIDNKKDIQAKLYIASHENDVIATNFMIYYGDTVVYLFGGSADIKRNLMAPYLLHWQAMKDAKEQGLKYYDFWGVEENPNHPWYGFSKFKLGFGGEVINYAGTKDYIFNTTWYNIYIGLRKLNRIIRK